MEALCFNLNGKTAFFKNPEVNSELNYSYGCIHKPALLGILGAILGYGGYAQQYVRKTIFPEYYEKLKDLKISIVPTSKSGTFPKKIQTFNNSVGYASQEDGGNLIVNEVWLENPSWDVYVLLDCEQANLISHHILDRRCMYYPFLGKNDHPATINDPKVLSLQPLMDDEFTLNSIGLFNHFEIVEDPTICYQEYLPIRLSEETNLYELDYFFFSDALLITKGEIYCDGNRNLAFY